MWATQNTTALITWTHTNDNMLRWMQTFQYVLHIDFKRMHTRWTPRPDSQACGEWNGNPIKLSTASSRGAAKKNKKKQTDIKSANTQKQTMPLPHVHVRTRAFSPPHKYMHTWKRTHTSQMNHPPKCLASSAFPESAVTAEHNCMTWESQGSNEMHTLSATSSSRHNSELLLKSKLS